MLKISGVICLAIGIFLLVWGHKIAHSVGSQMQQVFTGAPPDRAMHFYIGGLVLAILGVAQFFWKRK
jgi:uncharacterized membrane protein (DUF106 family)